MNRPQAPLEETHRVPSGFGLIHWALITLVILGSLGAIYVAEAVIAPVAFSLFLISIVWPLRPTGTRFAEAGRCNPVFRPTSRA